MKIKNKHKAFTLAEIFVVIAVIGVLTAITVCSVFNSAKSKNRKTQVITKTFYSNLETVYNDVLNNYTTGYSLKNLTDATGEAAADNKILAKAFSRYLDGEILDSCDDLKVASGQVISSYKDENLVCARFNSDIVAGFSYNNGCIASSSGETDTSELEIFEYLKIIEEDEQGEVQARSIENTCGYVIYGFSNGSGTFMKDLFTIALGKRGTK